MTIEEIEREISLLEPGEINTRNVQILSSLYIIRDRFGTTVNTANFKSGSEFGSIVKKKNIGDVLSVVDELMEAVYVYNRPLYDATIRKLTAE